MYPLCRTAGSRRYSATSSCSTGQCSSSSFCTSTSRHTSRSRLPRARSSPLTSMQTVWPKSPTKTSMRSMCFVNLFKIPQKIKNFLYDKQFLLKYLPRGESFTNILLLWYEIECRNANRLIDYYFKTFEKRSCVR